MKYQPWENPEKIIFKRQLKRKRQSQTRLDNVAALLEFWLHLSQVG
jgi:hypothetical protein